MRLIIDTSKTTFMVTRQFELKVDPTTGEVKTDRKTKNELYTVQLMALDENGGEVILVTVAGPVREVPRNAPVSVVELEAIPWNGNNGRHGVAFRAASVEPINANTGRTTNAA